MCKHIIFKFEGMALLASHVKKKSLYIPLNLPHAAGQSLSPMWFTRGALFLSSCTDQYQVTTKSKKTGQGSAWKVTASFICFVFMSKSLKHSKHHWKVSHLSMNCLAVGSCIAIIWPISFYIPSFKLLCYLPWIPRRYHTWPNNGPRMQGHAYSVPIVIILTKSCWFFNYLIYNQQLSEVCYLMVRHRDK